MCTMEASELALDFFYVPIERENPGYIIHSAPKIKKNHFPGDLHTFLI